ncbi:MAG: general stress protein [Chitinophagaceae bacterium]
MFFPIYALGIILLAAMENIFMENNNELQNRPNPESKTSKRGLASADPQTRAAVARKGGEAVSRNREHMAAIGRKGGQTVSQDRQHMSMIGRKGGEAVSRDRQHMSEIGRKGGENSRNAEARQENRQLLNREPSASEQRPE